MATIVPPKMEPPTNNLRSVEEPSVAARACDWYPRFGVRRATREVVVEDLGAVRARDDVNREVLLVKKAFWRRADWWKAREATEEGWEAFAS